MMNLPKALFRVLTGVGALAVLMLAANANGQECSTGCGMQTVACVKTARTTQLACKRDCRAKKAPTALGSCIRGCMSTFRSSHAACRTGHRSCVQSCSPASAAGPAGASCPAMCGVDLGTCARGVVTALSGCVSGCRTSSDPGTCLEGCVATAQSSVASCWSDFATCLSSCGVTA